MKARDIRDLDDTELGAKQREAHEQLFRLRFQIQMGQTDGVKKYRVLRKDLARILTEQRGRELAGRS